MDFVGAPYLPSNLASLARDGRLVLQGFMGGMKVPNFDMGPLLFKRLKIEGSTLRSRDLEYQSNLVQSFVESGGLASIVSGIKQESKGDEGHHLAIHKVRIWLAGQGYVADACRRRSTRGSRSRRPTMKWRATRVSVARCHSSPSPTHAMPADTGKIIVTID